MRNKTNSDFNNTYNKIMNEIAPIVKKAINEALHNLKPIDDIEPEEPKSSNDAHNTDVYYSDFKHYNDILNNSKYIKCGLLWFDKSFKFALHPEINTLCDYIDNFDINSLPDYILKNIYDRDYYDIDFSLDDDEYYYNPYDEYVTEEYKLPFSEMLSLGVEPKLKIDENVHIESAYNLACELEAKYGVFLRTVTAEHKNKKMKNGIVKVEYLPSFLNSSFVVLSSGKKINNKENLTNLDILDKDCYSQGYYRIRTSLKRDKDGNDYYMSIYNPVRDESIREQFENGVIYLFHLSPTEVRNSIIENGIIPGPGGRTYNYKEPRAFFITDTYKNTNYLTMMKGIYNKSKRNGSKLSGIYDIWQIDVSEIPEDIDFFLDPNENHCVFSKEPISFNFLTLFGTIDLNEPFDPRNPKITKIKKSFNI